VPVLLSVDAVVVISAPEFASALVDVPGATVPLLQASLSQPALISGKIA
jgi:hypothetical protein